MIKKFISHFCATDFLFPAPSSSTGATFSTTVAFVVKSRVWVSTALFDFKRGSYHGHGSYKSRENKRITAPSVHRTSGGRKTLKGNGPAAVSPIHSKQINMRMDGFVSARKIYYKSQHIKRRGMKVKKKRTLFI